MTREVPGVGATRAGSTGAATRADAGVPVPYALERLRTLMSPEPGNPLELEGVLNPAVGRTADGRLWLLPRLVAAGNLSRIGLAEVEVHDGEPVSVRRDGLALEPDQGFERGRSNAGVEDPRVTWVPRLGVHVMTYTAYGPLGPKIALAVTAPGEPGATGATGAAGATGLRGWRRLGPVHFDYEPALDVDLNHCPNKDAVLFPEPVPGPDGRPAYALLHRPDWDLSGIRPGEGAHPPRGLTDTRPGIWISYVPAGQVEADLSSLVRLRAHRLVALPAMAYEDLKIGAGPPPIRVPEGWLLVHHGVTGRVPTGWADPGEQRVRYAAGAMLLDPDDPARVLGRTTEPLLEPETEHERSGTVANVVFPTAIAHLDGQPDDEWFVFYGMADARIGVARLTHT